jgi:hypothetical protein
LFLKNTDICKNKRSIKKQKYKYDVYLTKLLLPDEVTGFDGIQYACNDLMLLMFPRYRINVLSAAIKSSQRFRG